MNLDSLKEAALNLYKDKVQKTPIEKLLQEATSNENWSAPTKILQEISDITYNYNDFNVVMKFIWDKLSKHNNNWKKIIKTLNLIEYLAKNGAPRCIGEFKDSIFLIKQFQDYQCYEEQVDRGEAIRQRVQAIVDLLNDEQKLDAEREQAKKLRDKLQNLSAISSQSSNQDYSSSNYGGNKYGQSSYSSNSRNISNTSNRQDNSGGGYSSQKGYDNYEFKGSLDKYRKKEDVNAESEQLPKVVENKKQEDNKIKAQQQQEKEQEKKQAFQSAVLKIPKPGEKGEIVIQKKNEQVVNMLTDTQLQNKPAPVQNNNQQLIDFDDPPVQPAQQQQQQQQKVQQQQQNQQKTDLFVDWVSQPQQNQQQPATQNNTFTQPVVQQQQPQFQPAPVQQQQPGDNQFDWNWPQQQQQQQQKPIQQQFVNQFPQQNFPVQNNIQQNPQSYYNPPSSNNNSQQQQSYNMHQNQYQHNVQQQQHKAQAVQQNKQNVEQNDGFEEFQTAKKEGSQPSKFTDQELDLVNLNDLKIEQKKDKKGNASNANQNAFDLGGPSSNTVGQNLLYTTKEELDSFNLYQGLNQPPKNQPLNYNMPQQYPGMMNYGVQGNPNMNMGVGQYGNMYQNMPPQNFNPQINYGYNPMAYNNARR